MSIEAQPYDSWFESRWGSYAFGIHLAVGFVGFER